MFGEVRNGSKHFTPLGRTALDARRLIHEINEGLVLHGHVVMPDHVHFRLHLALGLGYAALLDADRQIASVHIS